MDAIWWIRRDLRLKDNPALSAALSAAERVMPVFILDPLLFDSHRTGELRRSFLLGGIKKLAHDLESRGNRLYVFRGRPLDLLKWLVATTQAAMIYAEEDVSPYAVRRDAEIGAQLPLKLVGLPYVRHPAAVLKSDGSPYTVFTPYSRSWKAIPLPETLPIPEKIPPAPEAPGNLLSGLSVDLASVNFIPGEAEALRRLAHFTQGAAAPIYRYHEQRNFLHLDGTSKLSPYFHFGMLSARQAARAALAALNEAEDDSSRKGVETWLNELIWREFYGQILYHFPNVRKESFRPDLRRIEWRNDESDFEAWREGRTGVPVVDAAMRQLAKIGWMHNRARMVVASYLTKDLLIDWRWGEGWFLQKLLDADVASNNGGWQWTAGTGTDAAPYFRIFNPVSQGLKFDPMGDYVRRWVKELRDVPLDYIHRPWEMPLDLQKKAGCIIGKNYPAPRVDHNFARERVLSAFRMAKS